MSNPVIQFRDAMQNVFGHLDWLPVPDGNIHRFRVPEDKPNTSNGWYVLYLDGIASGAFGSWKAGSSNTWSSRKPTDMKEIQLVEQRIEYAKQQREEAQARQHIKAADKAGRIWCDAQPAQADHPYLLRKGIKPHRLRQSGDTLLVPLYADGLLMNLQRIYPNGAQRFPAGGKVKGCYSPIGRLELGEPLYIAEGWATGASIHEETGCAVACAMSAGNLLNVGRQLQRYYPESILIIAGDDDRKSEAEGKGNAGVEAATKAASVLGCSMVLPVFPPEAPLELSDFNDLANWRAGR